MGLCGVASSVLILFEAAIAAVREEGSTAVVVEVAVQSEREGLVPVSTLDAES